MALRNGWNFHGDIAINLEGIARRHYGDVHRPLNKIYDADEIESGNFSEVMIILIRDRTGFSNDYPEIDKFVKECAPFVGMDGSDIPGETAQNLFDTFQKLYQG